MTKRRYGELAQLQTIEERYNYLKLRGGVGKATFGSERYLNQIFYGSRQWKQTRDHVIIRDLGCDLGVFGWEINDRIYIHHMNPMTIQQIVDGDPDILNPDYLITVTHRTHNAIHYGNDNLLPQIHVDRKPGDTKLW